MRLPNLKGELRELFVFSRELGATFCSICDGPLIRSSERYMVCPKGHGKLIPVPPEKFDDENAEHEENEFLKRMNKAFKGVKKK